MLGCFTIETLSPSPRSLALLVISKNWKQPGYPLTRERKNKIWLYVECSTAVKRNKEDPCGLDVAKPPRHTVLSERKAAGLLLHLA